MLTLGLAEAASFPGPDGPIARTTEMVRAAAATLREPRRRLFAELFATSTSTVPPSSSTTTTVAPTAAERGWPDALRALGWGPR